MVQFAIGRHNGLPVPSAIKCFARRADYDEEVRIYEQCASELQDFMPKVLRFLPNDDGRIKDPFGNAMPPCIVLEKGECLQAAGRIFALDLFSSVKVCALAAMHAQLAPDD